MTPEFVDNLFVTLAGFFFVTAGAIQAWALKKIFEFEHRITKLESRS